MYSEGDELEYHSNETNQVLDCVVLSVQSGGLFIVEFKSGQYSGSKSSYHFGDKRFKLKDHRLEPFERYMAGRKE